MDKQQIFDTVATHLLKQGEAATSHGRCRYRTESGLMCAVGCLIPDEKYTPKIEGRAVRDIPHMLPFYTTFDDLTLLGQLQAAHDLELIDSGIEAWKGRMLLIAADYKLNAEALAD